MDALIVDRLSDAIGASPLFDRLVFRVATTALFKGVVMATLLWWCWLRRGGRLIDEEARSVKTVIGVLLAVLVGRVLQLVLPFRPRPLHDPGYPSVVPGSDLRMLSDWSSFPSDHAVMFFAVAAAVWSYSRLAGAWAFAWVALVICLPRVYIGFHYPSDILAGAAIGIAVMAAALRLPLPRGLHRAMMRAQAHHPGWLYAGAFFLTFQIATQFDDIRGLLETAARIISGA